MTRRPLVAAGLVGTLLGGLVSGCSDAGTAADSAAANSAQSASATVTADASKVTAAPDASAAGADDFASVWGPAVGSTIPMLAANDHTGTAQDLASLSGDKGLLLVFSRSADW